MTFDINTSTTDKMTQTIQKIPMSNFLIEKYGLTNIKSLVDIAQFISIDQLFGKFNYIVIFLQLQEKNQGHWVCLFKNKTGLFYFDSYGHAPLSILKKMKNKYNQNMNLLTLIENSKYKDNFIYSTFGYQSLSPNSAVCGRFCIVVCVLNMIMKDFDFIKFNTYMNVLKKKTNKSYDFIVSEFVSRTD